MSYTLKELADYLNAELIGDESCVIESIETLQDASAGSISFLANKTYKKYLAETAASAVILHPDMKGDFSGNCLFLDNPYLGYAQLSSMFAPKLSAQTGIHSSAVIADDAKVDVSAIIGPQVVIEAGAVIEAGVKIDAGCVVGADTVVGENSHLYPQVVLYHGVSLGKGTIIHSGVVIGADGFGFAPDQGQWVKIHQLGGVVIADNVEIGAGTTIDRGALGDTTIGTGSKIDNLIQIGHNVSIGEHTVIAACTAIAGSTKIGSHCVIAGCAAIVGHLTIVDNVQITGMSLISKSISEPGSYSSGTPMSKTDEWRKRAVRFGQLDKMAARIKKLEKSNH